MNISIQHVYNIIASKLHRVTQAVEFVVNCKQLTVILVINMRNMIELHDSRCQSICRFVLGKSIRFVKNLEFQFELAALVYSASSVFSAVRQIISAFQVAAVV